MRALPLVAVGCAALVAAGCSSGQSSPSPSATSSTGGSASADILKTVYAQATPPNAPTQQMTLYSVTLAPGASIAPHQHPGLQLSRIVSGTLTYTVLAGQATAIDGTVNGNPGPARALKAPSTTELGPGSALIEPEGEVHTAKNVGTVPVEIQLSVLVPQGDQISVPEPAYGVSPTPTKQ